ncbi:MAG: 3-carboxy-cis,cis-muconate cycloisomerase [Alphaproteobacteria bacterium]|nr:3-carboxy-cis,cis-muconate cycloisomerase [Alphaproteobacteria bacterium]
MTGYLDPIFSDPDVGPLLGTPALLAAMVEMERGLARAQARIGVIPEQVGSEIDRALTTFVADEDEVARGVESSGVPVIALVAQLREAVGGAAGSYVHWGATTQDVMDTALVLRMRHALDLIDLRLAKVIHFLADAAERHRCTVMPGRTRFQQALPISFGLKLVNWMLPLHRHRLRLTEMRDRVLTVQFGGAAGTLAALDDRGLDVMVALGEELDLPVPVMHWHAQRDGLVELGSWFGNVAGSLGKIGQDAVLLAQSEFGELRELPGAGGARGGSSTMPQKANPVSGEALIAVAREAAGLVGTLHQAQIQEHERGSPGWTLEWQVLPRLAIAAAAATRHAEGLVDRMDPQIDRMRANLGSDGLIMAEAASFALARHMPRPEAQAVVKTLALDVARSGGNLFDRLKSEVDAPVDWAQVADPANYLGDSDRLIDRALAEVRVLRT